MQNPSAEGNHPRGVRFQPRGVNNTNLSSFADTLVRLHPDAVSNAELGLVFEELIRRFAELSNENRNTLPRDQKPKLTRPYKYRPERPNGA